MAQYVGTTYEKKWDQGRGCLFFLFQASDGNMPSQKNTFSILDGLCFVFFSFGRPFVGQSPMGRGSIITFSQIQLPPPSERFPDLLRHHQVFPRQGYSAEAVGLK